MLKTVPTLHLYDVRFTERIRLSTLVLATDATHAKALATQQWQRHCRSAINEQMTTTAVLGFADACRFEVHRIPQDQYPTGTKAQP